ncbi:MAG TPA: AMP-binding protein [Acetobacteraceae bacterium]|nr:AMP-binding protein [Acetobacteraceae bacterium]
MTPDTFARDNLPPREQWPDLLEAGLGYPARLNATAELLDRHTDRSRRCLLSPDTSWSYVETAERVERIASVLTRRLGMIPGNRVLLRAPNSPLLAAAILAVIRAGGIAVPTMSMLRAGELRKIIDKARIGLALCDHRLTGALADFSDVRTVAMGSDGADDLTAMMAQAPLPCPAADTAADDVCLIAFTSGTTGEPKGTMHFHRDLLAVCDTYGAHVLRPRPDDLFVGSPPLAFTFGLGGLLLFPLRVGAATLLLEQASPEHLLAAFRTQRPSVCFTAPTAFRAMLGQMQPGDVDALRACVSAGEALPKSVWEAWHARTGIRILDGIGSTEMLHIFIGSPEEAIRPGATGLPVPGYEAKLIDGEGRTLPRGSEGRLAVRGPTGCRYLADARQTVYVEAGWNVTGDTYFQDGDGYFWFRARSDDMIVSSGYNIAGPEVEAALLGHASVAECAVVAAPDAARGHVPRAFVVPRPGITGSDALAHALQEHVKAEIAPYKYPRVVSFVERLPRTESGKLQRFALRAQAEEEAGLPGAPG